MIFFSLLYETMGSFFHTSTIQVKQLLCCETLCGINPVHQYLCAAHYRLTAVIMSMFHCITVCMQGTGSDAKCPSNAFDALYMSTSCVLTSCDLILFIFMRSSKLYLICVADLFPLFLYVHE